MSGLCVASKFSMLVRLGEFFWRGGGGLSSWRSLSRATLEEVTLQGHIRGGPKRQLGNTGAQMSDLCLVASSPISDLGALLGQQPPGSPEWWLHANSQPCLPNMTKSA